MTELEAIKARHSVRQYLDKPIDAEKIEAIQVYIDQCNREGVEAALLAPTAVNQQKFEFVLHDDNRVEAVAKFSLIGYAHLDLGIAKYHFEVGAGNGIFEWL